MRVQLVFASAVAVLLISVSPASAQRVGGGIKGGVNSATLTFVAEPQVTWSRRSGLVAGAFVSVKIAPGVAFQPEVLYSQEGQKARIDLGTRVINATFSFDYIRVPMLLRLGRTGKSGVYAVVGPAFGGLVSAKLEATGEQTQDLRDGDGLDTVDVSFVAGAGVNVSRLLVEGRYMVGLRNTQEGSDSFGPNKGKVFTVLVGVHF